MQQVWKIKGGINWGNWTGEGKALEDLYRFQELEIWEK